MEQKPTNFVRRTFGVVVASLPLVLSLASVVFGSFQHRQPTFAGIGFMIPAAFFAVFNFHLSFIRPHLFRFRHGSMDGYRFVSGIPVVGSILIALGSLFSFGAIGSALIGCASFCLDTGGSGWFVIATWKDRSFWDT
jgi:hypothetical protein